MIEAATKTVYSSENYRHNPEHLTSAEYEEIFTQLDTAEQSLLKVGELYNIDYTKEHPQTGGQYCLQIALESIRADREYLFKFYGQAKLREQSMS